MTFANPLWFLLLIPAGILFAVRAYSLKTGKPALPFSDLNLLKSWTRSFFKEDYILETLKAASVIFMVVAMARPQSVNKSAEPPKPVVDIMLCLDTSISMAAMDFDPDNRLEAAKKSAVDFIKKRPADRMGLVVFGGSALLQCPLTLDHESLTDFIKTIELNATQTNGTAVGTALALASSRLSESEAKSKVIILLTDGRSNFGSIDPMTAASAANDLGMKIYTIGCAVPGGGVIPDIPELNIRGGQMAEDLDEGTLAAVAAQTRAKYYRVTSEKKFKEIYNEIDRLEKTKVETVELTRVDDRYLLFLILSLLLFALAMGLNVFVWRTIP